MHALYWIAVTIKLICLCVKIKFLFCSIRDFLNCSHIQSPSKTIPSTLSLIKSAFLTFSHFKLSNISYFFKEKSHLHNKYNFFFLKFDFSIVNIFYLFFSNQIIASTLYCFFLNKLCWYLWHFYLWHFYLWYFYHFGSGILTSGNFTSDMFTYGIFTSGIFTAHRLLYCCWLG